MNANFSSIYETLLSSYGPQDWWPIINDKTLRCEYKGGPTNEDEIFEVICGCILTQGTQWYPNVVRALQQLKIGRLLTKNELEVLREAKISDEKISKNIKKITKSNIFTQNTAWTNVEKALDNLRKNKCLSINGILETKQETLAQYIKSAGYFNQKTERLKIIAEFLVQHPLNELEKMETNELRSLLLSIKGIGPETADSILLYAFNKPSFVIDAYTKRIISRIGLTTKDVTYDELQNMITRNISQDTEMYNEYHALLVEHAKRYCQKKPICKGCSLNTVCRKMI